jgi:hypothetical protein
MNSPKVVAALGLILIFSVFLTACGGGSSKTPPPPPGPPTITTSTLTNGVITRMYLNSNGSPVSLFATGGTGSYTWSISSGSLPPGLSLNSQTGTISGMPTAVQAGGFPFTAMVTDAALMTATASLNIYIEGLVSITPTVLPSGSVGVAYSQTLTASGGLPPYTWGGSPFTCGQPPPQPNLPAGLTLNTSTGVISGTPTTNGSPTNVAIQVCDSETSPGIPATGFSNFTITIMTITTASLPSGFVNMPYNFTLMENGGVKPWTWSIVSGSLPTGMTLSGAGVLSGTPTQAGNFPVTVKVTDGEKPNAAVATASFVLGVYQGSQLIINTTGLPTSGVEGMPYSGSLMASGGVAPYNWSIISGSLPPGLSLDPATCTNSSVPCIVSGTPTTVGPFNFTVQALDSGSPQQPASAPLKILITGSPLVITTTTLPAGNVGVPYSATLMASGGLKPYTWSITNGSLPAGLNLDPTTCTKSSVPCVISGTPTSAGTFPFTAQVQDSGSPQQTVPAQLSIVITSLGNSTLNGNYVFTFSGYNSGTPVVMAGSFVADGKGGLTSGVLDYNDGTGEPVNGSGSPIPQTIQAGAGSVYNITPNGLGTMMITTDKMVFQLAIAIRNDGSGRLIQSDTTNPNAYGSGAIMPNTPLSQGEQFPLCGSHVALGFFGYDNTLITRYAGAGTFQFDPSTCVDVESGVMDTDDGGSLSSPTFTGAFNQLDNPTSRGITGLTLNPGGRHFYAFYLVSSSDRKTNRLFWVATEPASKPAALNLWSALQQVSPPAGWNNSNLAGGTAVAELSALDTTPAVDVTAGLFAGTGSSSNNCQNNNFDSATFNYDENQGGTSSLQQTSSGTYCVDKNTGRVTLTAFNAGPFATPPVFYLVKTNQAFVVGTDAAVTSGYLEPQTGSPFSNSSLFGLYAGGAITPVTANVTNGVTSLVADGNGDINGTENTSGPGGPNQQQFTYTYTVDATGRAVVQQSGTTIGIAYVISPTKFVLLPTTDVNPALSIIGQ